MSPNPEGGGTFVFDVTYSVGVRVCVGVHFFCFRALSSEPVNEF